MPILNYTTEVAASKSIAEIQRILAKHGARSITTDYDLDGNICGLSFSIMIEQMPLAIRLPCDVDGVLRALLNADGVPRRSRNKDQARRVAWRILKDWLEAQLALYEVGQAEMAQVLMPYAIDSEGRTAYSMFKEGHVRQLNAAPDNVVEGKFKAAGE